MGTANHQQAELKYFSHDKCSVCHVLQPKVKKLLGEKFPRMAFEAIDIERMPEVAAQHQVFSAPTLLLYFEGKEYHRFTRNVAITQLETAISRPYNLLFHEA